MAIDPGTYELGPQDGRLTVHTARAGAASKAGHDLVIVVERWSATVDWAADPAKSRLELTADSTSFSVQEGRGGVKPLSDDDRRGIVQTINEKVLKGTPITFRSTAVRPDADDRFRVTGDLELLNGVNLVAFDLTVSDDGRVSATAGVTQSEWGIKPYSALLGALKVADEVQVALDARLRPSS